MIRRREPCPDRVRRRRGDAAGHAAAGRSGSPLLSAEERLALAQDAATPLRVGRVRHGFSLGVAG